MAIFPLLLTIVIWKDCFVTAFLAMTDIRFLFPKWLLDLSSDYMVIIKFFLLATFIFTSFIVIECIKYNLIFYIGERKL
ncbi:MAG: hypothetical protein A2104_00560 [Candidatus Melainabacteria bacterium GWF2_32_7]|nr:MAG: hypothetical protein A2104_00560 [Candidatus Melainabacteria bacterium GWF2_32_7]